jgi:uncharacterized protein (DUF1684 family)
MKILLTANPLLVISNLLIGQTFEDEVKEFQRELNVSYLDPQESPLPAKARKKFKGHDFYPIDEQFKVTATLNRMVTPVMIQMKTSTTRIPTFEKYGVATFEIDGVQYNLTIYLDRGLQEKEEYKDYLFLPFTDLTNGIETYSGGRYIDMRIPPSGDTIVIDFNKAYNPYCAYSPLYSCPVPPSENNLNVAIAAGVKLSGKH